MTEDAARGSIAALRLSWVVLAVTGLVLAGWVLGVEALTHLVPSWPPLLPLNAVDLALLAGAVVLQTGRSRPEAAGSISPRRVLVARVLALTAGLGGVVVVLGHVVGRWFDLIPGVVSDSLATLPGEFPFRPTLQAGVSTLALAVATGTIRLERRGAVSLFASGLVVGLAVPAVAILSYLYSTNSATEVSASIGMTVTIALGLTLVGLAALVARPDRPPLAWYRRLDDRGTLGRLALVFIGLPLVVWLVRDTALTAGLPLDTALLLGLITGTVLVAAGVYALSRVQTRAVREELAAERALAAVEDRFRELRARAPIGMALFDDRGHVIETNPALQAFLNQDEETLRAWAWTNGARAGSGFDPAEFRRLLAGEIDRYRTTTSVAASDGTLRFGDVTIVAIRDSDSRVANLVAQIVDTTEREVAQAAVHRLLVERDALLRRLPVGVFRLRMGADGDRLEYVSSAFAAQLGVPEDRLLADVGVGFAAIAEDDVGSLVAVIDAARERGQGFVWEGRTSGGGTARWIRVEATVARADDGAVLLEGVQQDITERKRAEREIVEARAAAEAASLAKSSFLANMSHEIRTPLNAVLGLLGLLRDSGLTWAQQDYARKADQAARSLLDILNDVLDYSKIEAGRMEVHPEPFDLDRLLRDLGVAVASTAGVKRLDLLFDVEPGVPVWVVGDALRLRQVLLNLFSNAVKFTQVGEVRLGVRVLEAGPDRVRLSFRVSDTGIGIDAEAQERIFEGFSQAEASTSRRFGGTGLGLTISRLLLRLMGSDLALTSSPGVGSTFSFDLDLGTVPSDGQTRGPARAALTGLRALVVSDRAASGEILERMCRSWRWETVRVGDARAAHAVLAAGSPHDVVVVDLAGAREEVRDVVGATRAAAARTGGRTAVVVVASGADLAEATGWNPESLDADVVLVMPVTASMVFDAVTDALAAGATGTVQEEAGAQRLAGVRVLLAEDNELNQEVATEMLRREGAVVTAVGDGARAVDLVEHDAAAFDVVLMDMQMPVLDGPDAVRRIRRGGRGGALPIVAMTANATESDRRTCLDAGMDDHLAKPYDAEDLVAAVRRWADEPGVLDAGAALDRLGGRADFLDRMLGRFVDRLPGVTDELRRALGVGALQDLARGAHALKGAAATVGAARLADVAGRLEAAASTEDAGACGRELGLVGEVGAVTRARIDAWRAGLADREPSGP